MSTPRQVATFAGSVGMEGDEDDEPMSSAAKPRHTCLGMLQPRLSNRWALFQPTVTLIVDRSDHDVRTFTGRVRWAWTSEKVSAQLFSQPTAEDQRAFIDAVHSLVTLQHPNLLRVYGTSTSGRDVFVIIWSESASFWLPPALYRTFILAMRRMEISMLTTF
ncbi:hypothetical protein EXIGLDRAFT_288072 [Exidia glandulosa HHB12029]|uniref:Protein kinase domain-containing protein n=1 Tax=Exidia glandulosa HHB12029 TaxID=1314781 RepID=A0A165DGG2_EXIGL|nr:hypothetical protein EXIGLDRAFT_288072 [Exidia glandulosa HHB12029]